MKKVTLVLVYQAGIANVFQRHGKKHFTYSRELQNTFNVCENFCRGARYMGATIITAWCNEAGDIAERHWNFSNFENAPFCENFAIDLIQENQVAPDESQLDAQAAQAFLISQGIETLPN